MVVPGVIGDANQQPSRLLSTGGIATTPGTEVYDMARDNERTEQQNPSTTRLATQEDGRSELPGPAGSKKPGGGKGKNGCGISHAARTAAEYDRGVKDRYDE